MRNKLSNKRGDISQSTVIIILIVVLIILALSIFLTKVKTFKDILG